MEDFQKGVEPGNEKERIYDEQIYPLIQQVLELCEKHDIHHVATFHLGDTLFVTSAKTTEDSPQSLHLALMMVCPDQYRWFVGVRFEKLEKP